MVLERIVGLDAKLMAGCVFESLIYRAPRAPVYPGQTFAIVVAVKRRMCDQTITCTCLENSYKAILILIHKKYICVRCRHGSTAFAWIVTAGRLSSIPGTVFSACGFFFFFFRPLPRSTLFVPLTLLLSSISTFLLLFISFVLFFLPIAFSYFLPAFLKSPITFVALLAELLPAAREVGGER